MVSGAGCDVQDLTTAWFRIKKKKIKIYRQAGVQGVVAAVDSVDLFLAEQRGRRRLEVDGVILAMRGERKTGCPQRGHRTVTCCPPAQMQGWRMREVGCETDWGDAQLHIGATERNSRVVFGEHAIESDCRTAVRLEVRPSLTEARDCIIICGAGRGKMCVMD